MRDFENELRLHDEFREIITEIRKIRDLDRIAENIEALKKHLVGEDAKELLNDYFESIEKRYGYLDLKGFSPRIGRKEIVKIPLDDIFIPLKFVDEAKIDYSEARSYIPIYVEIADYSAKMSQFSDLYSFVVNSDSKYKNLFKWAIENGKALIPLDGLDEVIDAAHRMKVSKEIGSFLQAF